MQPSQPNWLCFLFLDWLSAFSPHMQDTTTGEETRQLHLARSVIAAITADLEEFSFADLQVTMPLLSVHEVHRSGREQVCSSHQVLLAKGFPEFSQLHVHIDDA